MQNDPHSAWIRPSKFEASGPSVFRSRTFAPPLNFDTSCQAVVCHPVDGVKNFQRYCHVSFRPGSEKSAKKDVGFPSRPGLGLDRMPETIGAMFWT